MTLSKHRLSGALIMQQVSLQTQGGGRLLVGRPSFAAVQPLRCFKQTLQRQKACVRGARVLAGTTCSHMICSPANTHPSCLHPATNSL